MQLSRLVFQFCHYININVIVTYNAAQILSIFISFNDRFFTQHLAINISSKEILRNLKKLTNIFSGN